MLTLHNPSSDPSQMSPLYTHTHALGTSSTLRGKRCNCFTSSDLSVHKFAHHSIYVSLLFSPPPLLALISIFPLHFFGQQVLPSVSQLVEDEDGGRVWGGGGCSTRIFATLHGFNFLTLTNDSPVGPTRA